MGSTDRFYNWPPEGFPYGFPDPVEPDFITVRHEGISAVDLYDSTESPYYHYLIGGRGEPPPDQEYVNDLYLPVVEKGNGVSEFAFRLRFADGRVFKLDPTKTLDSGFEWPYGDDFYPWPRGWEYVSGDGAFQLDETVKRKGYRSVKFYDVLNDTVYRNRKALVFGEDIFSGMQYRLSAYIKCEDRGTNAAYARVVLNPNGGIFETPALVGDTAWAGPGGWAYTYVDFDAGTPMPLVDAYVEIVVEGGGGTVWFDEVRLEPLSHLFNGHFEYGGGDWWIGPVHGWRYIANIPGQNYSRSQPGYQSNYCLRVGAKLGAENVVRNDEKVYLNKGTTYTVTGWFKKDQECPEAALDVEFYTGKDGNYKTKSKTIAPTGLWQQFSITISPDDWQVGIPGEEYAYVKVACRVEAGSAGNAYFDNIEIIETNPVPNGNFELAEEGPHWPDRWDYEGAVLGPPAGAPAYSALYDADAKYGRRSWRVREAGQDLTYASETFVLEPDTEYALKGWVRNFDVLGPNEAGCYLRIKLYDGAGSNAGTWESLKVTDQDDWQELTRSLKTPAGPGGKYFARVSVVEEDGAYSSAADGLRVVKAAPLE